MKTRMWLTVMARSPLVAAAAALLFAANVAQADDYPTRPIHFVVPYPPGGGIDIAARLIQDRLGDILRQQIVIENRPGASGAVGAQYVAKAEPDGYTLLFSAGDFIAIPQLMPQMTFSPIKELLPIAMVTNSPMVLVASGKAPFNDFQGVLAAARVNPNGLSYATPGQGTINNVVGQWIAISAHIKMLQVAYRGGPAAAAGIAAGDVPLGIVQPPAVYPGLVDAGRVKVIALTGAKRPNFLPASWPTLAESGLPIDATVWIGLFAPLGTPDEIVARLDRAIGAVVQDGDARKRMFEAGINPEHLASTAFAAKIRDDAARYEAIIREAGMHFE